MDERTLKDLLKGISDEFQSNLSKDGDAKAILKKIEKGIATYEDAYEYSECVAAALSKALDRNITATMFETGQLDFETLKDILLPTYKKAHERINEACKSVQKALNESAKLGLNPAEIGFRSRRVIGIAKNASKREIFPDVRYAIMGPYLENFAQNVVDDNVKANVDLHGEAGLRPKVNRLLNGEGCQFCKTWAGEWEYPKVPKEVYQRHENCRCIVVYDPGDGRKQDVWSKAFYDSDISAEISRRIDDINNKRPLLEKVTTEYLKGAQPGAGKISVEKGFEDKNGERSFSSWLHKNLGGDITLQRSLDEQYKQHRADYSWRKKQWELKSPDNVSRSSVDRHLRKGFKQIMHEGDGLQGGIFFDFRQHSIDLENVEKWIEDILNRRKPQSGFDIMIVQNEHIISVLRYNKKR